MFFFNSSLSFLPQIVYEIFEREDLNGSYLPGPGCLTFSFLKSLSKFDSVLKPIVIEGEFLLILGD